MALTLEKPTFKPHKRAVFAVCQGLSEAGVYGRSDHIGHHPFNSASHRLTIDRVRPDIKLQLQGKIITVEVVCGSTLRRDRLRRALRLYHKKGYTSIVLCREPEIGPLRDALEICDIRVDYICCTIDRCIRYILDQLVCVTNTAIDTAKIPKNEP